MDIWARLPALVAGFVGIAALSWLTTPSVQTILPGDPDVALIVLSSLVLSISARLAISAPTLRIAWGRVLVFNGFLCLTVIALMISEESSVTNWIAGPISIGLGVGGVVTTGGLVLLAGAKRGGGASKNTSARDEAKTPDFAPEETLLYRRESGANYRIFVQHIWEKAEVSMAPLVAYVDDRPCRIVSVASRPRGGCYINVILDGVGFTLIAQAHSWSTEKGPVDVAAWGLNLLATEETSGSCRAAL